jgi:hypothetical protein
MSPLPPAGFEPADVVDESLIDAMLALCPEERLRHNDRMIRTVAQLRQGIEKPDPDDDRR